MLKAFDKCRALKRWLGLFLLVTVFGLPTLSLLPKPAFATDTENVWYFNRIEDPQLKKIVHELVDILKELWRMLWSFDWIKHPRVFYQTLKRVFVVWLQTMKELYRVLMIYIHQLNKEINSTKCADPACTHMVGR